MEAEYGVITPIKFLTVDLACRDILDVFRVCIRNYLAVTRLYKISRQQDSEQESPLYNCKKHLR